MRYQLIIFDWDGTLYDSSHFIVSCVQEAARRAEVMIPPTHVVRQMIGLSFDEALKRAIPDLSSEKTAKLRAIYRQCVMEADTIKPALFPKAKQTVQALFDAGYWLAIATGKGRAGLNADLTSLDLQSFFLTTRCAEETQSKPHPQMLFEIMDELGVPSEKTLMVGDTEYDVQLAKNAGVDAVAATYCVHKKEHLDAFDVKHFIDDIEELFPWVSNQK